MFVTVMMANSSYQNLDKYLTLEKDFDEELLISWMRRHYYIPWISCVLYTLTVLGLHRWMTCKPPVEFGSLVLPTWNALFAIFNLMVFLKVAPTRFNVLWNFGWTHCICHFYSHVGPVAFWNCIFFFSKFIWLIDVMFIILRKKTLTMFRFFHHISLFVYTWYMYTERQGLVWLSFMNALTTSVFYGVPLLTSLLPSTTRAASLFMIFVSLLEKFNTAGQLFYIIFRKWSGQDCDNNFIMVTVSVTMMIMYTVLLAHHYKVLSSEKKAKKLQKEK